ncbi:MAG: DUF2284 domain-containing protein [Planctomycetota bacterium]
MKKYAKHLKRALHLGVKGAKIIRTNSIVTAGWVRLKCQFGCDGYGGRLTCPPYAPAPAQTKEMLAHYKYALLIHGDKQTNVRNIAVILERDIFLDGYHKALGLGAGPCTLCARCSKTCKHPDKARPSMEACGIDVFGTARKNRFPIEVLKKKNANRNYYGLVLIE